MELLNEMQNKITEILNDTTTTNEEKGKDIEPVRAAYEEGLNNINAATTTGDVTTAKRYSKYKSSTNFMQIPVKKPAGKTELGQLQLIRKHKLNKHQMRHNKKLMMQNKKLMQR